MYGEHLPVGLEGRKQFVYMSVTSRTFHINDVLSPPAAQLVLGCTVIISRVRGADGAEDQVTSTLDELRTHVSLVPQVAGCNVSVAATGQSNLSALNDVTRGPERHRGKLWSVWSTKRKNEENCRKNAKRERNDKVVSSHTAGEL